MAKKRLDSLLVERGLAESREKAQALILAGEVSVAGKVIDKAGTPVPEASEIAIAHGLQYVSRGGLKLAHALGAFRLDPAGVVAADIGASTGGFTDCLLQNGAARVYAVDVGYGLLHWRLRTDPRVVTIERTNARYLTSLPEAIDVATVDVSFISLTLVLPAVARVLKQEGQVVALVKPQFEAGRTQVGRGGVVRDPEVHKQVLRRLLEWAGREGWRVRAATPSPILGPAGNREFLALLTREGATLATEDVDPVVDEGRTVFAVEATE
jgi:23S rRNA (cytidine1920-2'-O)/16S rRNA (cytidine1409-2'-O)-methyltransferase